jgi:hypothetical protein
MFHAYTACAVSWIYQNAAVVSLDGLFLGGLGPLQMVSLPTEGTKG